LPILFQPGTGINKIGAIGHWFIKADGTRASKKKCGGQSLPVGIPTTLALRTGNQEKLRSD
jgi:hypothetical protein